jgi:nicotinamide riboside transporter PnuC
MDLGKPMRLSVITTYVLRSVLMAVAVIALNAKTLDLLVAVISVPIPSTFSWKNKGFEEHERSVGPANMRTYLYTIRMNS